jgi:hypothetical protein
MHTHPVIFLFCWFDFYQTCEDSPDFSVVSSAYIRMSERESERKKEEKYWNKVYWTCYHKQKSHASTPAGFEATGKSLWLDI